MAAESQSSKSAAFIKRARAVHGSAYAYDLVDYVDSRTPVLIACDRHGRRVVFKQTPQNHLKGNRCPECGARKGSSAWSRGERFVERARAVHGDRYLYDSATYTNAHAPVTIECPVHGLFEQRATKHLQGHGCPSCPSLQRQQAFRARALEVHGVGYDYDLSTYIHSRLPMTIVCRAHGQFRMTPTRHLLGYGCPSCGSAI